MPDRRWFRLLHIPFLVAAIALAMPLAGCQFAPATPTAGITPTPRGATPTPTLLPTSTPEERSPFQTYAHGELLPDMRVPIQRSATGEGGWYVVIGTEEGWAQFLSQMGQPAQIWEPVRWEEEILVGALLGVRAGRGYKIAIADLALGGVEDPQTKRRYVDLDLAKHHIDTLRILEEKTRGNLTDEEKRMLDRALYETRMQYVQMAQRVTGTAP